MKFQQERQTGAAQKACSEASQAGRPFATSRAALSALLPRAGSWGWLTPLLCWDHREQLTAVAGARAAWGFCSWSGDPDTMTYIVSYTEITRVHAVFVPPVFSPLTDGDPHPTGAIPAVMLALQDSSSQSPKGSVSLTDYIPSATTWQNQPQSGWDDGRGVWFHFVT